MSAIKRDLRAWLARLEIRASTSHWADRHAAHHRKTRRAVVEICEAIRKQLLLIGLDPELAVSLQRGEAAAELAAIPDSEALRAADEAIRMTMGKRWAYPWHKSSGWRNTSAMGLSPT
jgi:hypothetical protein